MARSTLVLGVSDPSIETNRLNLPAIRSTPGDLVGDRDR